MKKWNEAVEAIKTELLMQSKDVYLSHHNIIPTLSEHLTPLCKSALKRAEDAEGMADTEIKGGDWITEGLVVGLASEIIDDLVWINILDGSSYHVNLSNCRKASQDEIKSKLARRVEDAE